MNVPEIAGMIAGIDVEIADAEIAGVGLEELADLREERARRADGGAFGRSLPVCARSGLMSPSGPGSDACCRLA